MRDERHRPEAEDEEPEEDRDAPQRGVVIIDM
jgi:hypothetical protein